MPARQPTLTVGIPTWNRPEELQQGLAALAPQVTAAGGEVDVFVSDNASGPAVGELLARLAWQYPFLKFSRNNVNLGPDRNFIQILRHAAGQYVWLLSDDDFAAEGAIAELLRIIAAHRPSFIATNFEYCDGTRCLVRHQPQRKFGIVNDAPAVGIDAAFALRSHWIGFVSTNVYRRDLLDIPQYEANLEAAKHWIQVYIAAHTLRQESSGYLAAFPAVLSRAQEGSASREAFTRLMPDAFALVLDRFGASPSVRRQVLEEIRRFNLPFRAYVALRAARVPCSPLLIPNYYRLAALVPRPLALEAWRLKRWLAGKAHRLPRGLRAAAAVGLAPGPQQ